MGLKGTLVKKFKPNALIMFDHRELFSPNLLHLKRLDVPLFNGI